MQIEVAFVNRPNKNPKFGSIKGTDGNYYDISANVLDRYRKGMVFDAPVKTREYQGKTYYSIPDSFDPNTVGAIIPAPNGQTAPPRQNGYAPKDEELITRLAILKSLIESDMLGNNPGMTMDDLVALAWETAPKLKVRPQ